MRPPSALPPAESPSTRYRLAAIDLAAGAVAELAGQSAAAQGSLALADELTGLAGAFAGLGRQQPLLHDDLRRLRVLFQVRGQVIAHGRVDDAFDFAVAQLGLGLALELRLGHAERDDGRQALAAVVAAGGEVLVQAGLLPIGVQRAGDGGAEAGDVRAALAGEDVVHVGVNVLGELARVLHGHFQAHAFVLAADVDDVFVCRLAGPIEVLDELDDAAFVVERFARAGAHGHGRRCECRD